MLQDEKYQSLSWSWQFAMATLLRCELLAQLLVAYTLSAMPNTPVAIHTVLRFLLLHQNNSLDAPCLIGIRRASLGIWLLIRVGTWKFICLQGRPA